MAQGSWDIQLRIDAPWNLWGTIERFGHIVITPQRVGLSPETFGDATLLSVARYAGPVLEKTINNEGIHLGGAGMCWWLGDEADKGDVYESKISLSGTNLSTSLTSLLPDAITKGSVTEPGGTYEGVHQWETPLQAIRTLCASLGAEYRVNPDGTLDAGPKASVYTITSPQVVVVRRGYGSDPAYVGVNVERSESSFNSRPYINRAVVVTTNNDVTTLVGAQDRTPAPTATDIHGNTINRVQVLETSGSPVSVTTYLTSQMNEGTTVSNMSVDTEFYEITGGDMRVGDAFYCYDPPAFTSAGDTSPVEISFRGDLIFPTIQRLIEASWPIVPGMGVYYRSPAATPVYTDLTPFVQHEGDALGLATRY